MLRTSLIALLLLPLTVTTPAHAARKQADLTAWPTSKRYLPRTVAIASVSDTNLRYKCRVKAITPDTLTCRAAEGPDRVLQREGVAAIIDPEHTRRNGTIVLLTLSAASLAGSFFVPIAPSVILRIFTWAFLYGGAFGDNPTEARLIYWRSGTTVKLS